MQITEHSAWHIVSIPYILVIFIILVIIDSLRLLGLPFWLFFIITFNINWCEL